jgi:hypothetical protein
VEPPTAPKWPAGTELIISAIDAGQFRRVERRNCMRFGYRVQALLRLFSDAPGTPAREIFTRDVNSRGLGYITPHHLPLGHGGILEIVMPDGTTRSISSTLLRCREAAPGWYEGSLYFNRHQLEFARH